MPQFPFFTKVSTQISEMVGDAMAKINESVNILQEKDGSLGVDSCGMYDYYYFCVLVRSNISSDDRSSYVTTLK